MGRRVAFSGSPWTVRNAAVALCLGVLWLCWGMSGQATANMTHPFAFEFEAGSGCGASSIAVDEAAGAIYVLCDNTVMGSDDPTSIRRYHLNGTSYPFTENADYISGNVIT